MDALLPAFVAALAAEMGDRTQVLALLLAARFGARPAVLGGIALAAAVHALIAGYGGALVAPLLTPEARALLLALALLAAGIGAWLPQRAPALADGGRWGALPTSFATFFLLELGDKPQLLTAAVAARAGAPLLAATGAAAGVTVAAGLAIALGAALPRRALRRVVGTILPLVGLGVAIAALRLI